MAFMDHQFFATPEEFRLWLSQHHAHQTELWVAYYKKGSGIPSITWPESVDEALCYGWIDGLRKSIDDVSYKIRFTPRRPTSTWSTININRVEVLLKENRMMPAGIAAWEKRVERRSQLYSYEQKNMQLAPEYEAKVKANPRAWDYFQTLPPSAKKPSIWWVMSAKKEETRLRRLGILIECSEDGLRIPLIRPKRSS